MDRRVVQLAQRGDRDAFSSLAGELSDRLFGVAHRILRDFDAASDALQVALVRMWRDLPGLRDPDLVEGWAYRVLVRACHDELRRSRRRPPALRVVPIDVAMAGDPMEGIADRELLERAFGKLQVAQRAAIVLQLYADMSLTEIADTLDVPVGTVRSRLHYAKQALRAAIRADTTPGREERGA